MSNKDDIDNMDDLVGVGLEEVEDHLGEVGVVNEEESPEAALDEEELSSDDDNDVIYTDTARRSTQNQNPLGNCLVNGASGSIAINEANKQTRAK